MVEIYCILIINHRKSFSDVRPDLQDAVKARLLEQGYDTEGNLIKEV